MDRVHKPRLQIDFKTVMLIMAFFGVGTWSGVVLTIKNAAWIMIGPSTERAIHRAVLRERDTTNVTVRKVRDSILTYSEQRFDRIEILFEELPGGKKAMERMEKRLRDAEERKRRWGAKPPSSDIVIF